MNIEEIIDRLYDIEIPRKEIKILYSLGHYDGPRTALIKYNDKIYLAHNHLYSFFEDIDLDRVYFIYELPEERAIELLNWAIGYSENISSAMKWSWDGLRMENNIQKNEVWLKNNKMPEYHSFVKSSVGWFRGWKYLDSD